MRYSFWPVIMAVLLLASGPSSAAPPSHLAGLTGSLKGAIYLNGEPQPNALVAFFLTDRGAPLIKGGKRRVPEMITYTDSQGSFLVDLQAGRYYGGILLGRSGRTAGPPRKGERFYFAASGRGILRIFTVKARVQTDVGRVDSSPPDTFQDKSEYFVVSGRITRTDGTPVTGVVVLAKSQLNMPKPEFISNKTDVEGVYSLKLPTTTPYYLIARETIADARPRPGKYIGTYGISSATGLAAPSIFSAASPPPGVLATGDEARAQTVSGRNGEQLTGIDIRMYKVPDPAAIKASIQGSRSAQKLFQSKALSNIYFAVASHVLTEDSYAELDKWLEFLLGRDDLNIEINGHADDSEPLEAGQDISMERALAVATYLSHRGIDRNRMKIRGLGHTQPLASASEDDRNNNRRVEIKFAESP